jgi:lysophospholipase L1-like esterase
MTRRNFIQAIPFIPASIQAAPISNIESGLVKQVINSGVGGNNTVNLLARISKDCLDHHPDLTILMAGTNDMNSQKHVPIAEYLKNMQQIIDQIVRIKSRLILMNLLPVYEPYLFTRHKQSFYEPEGHHGRLLQMNDSIKNLASKNKLGFVNIYHIFQKIGNIGTDASSLIKNEANSQTTDGLHPTPEGYRVIALAVYNEVMNRFPDAKKIVCFGDSITAGDGKPEGNNYPSFLQKLLTD